MYNRYIPQPDGSYRRSRVPEQRSNPAPQKCQPPPKPEPECPPVPKAPPCNESNKNKCKTQEKGCNKQEGSGAGFLQQLLPKDFDTGDLLVILLLLLMAGDSPEDRSTALLTLAMYFIL